MSENPAFDDTPLSAFSASPSYGAGASLHFPSFSPSPLGSLGPMSDGSSALPPLLFQSTSSPAAATSPAASSRDSLSTFISLPIPSSLSRNAGETGFDSADVAASPLEKRAKNDDHLVAGGSITGSSDIIGGNAAVNGGKGMMGPPAVPTAAERLAMRSSHNSVGASDLHASSPSGVNSALFSATGKNAQSMLGTTAPLIAGDMMMRRNWSADSLAASELLEVLHGPFVSPEIALRESNGDSTDSDSVLSSSSGQLFRPHRLDSLGGVSRPVSTSLSHQAHLASTSIPSSFPPHQQEFIGAADATAPQGALVSAVSASAASKPQSRRGRGRGAKRGRGRGASASVLGKRQRKAAKEAAEAEAAALAAGSAASLDPSQFLPSSMPPLNSFLSNTGSPVYQAYATALDQQQQAQYASLAQNQALGMPFAVMPGQQMISTPFDNLAMPGDVPSSVLPGQYTSLGAPGGAMPPVVAPIGRPPASRARQRSTSSSSSSNSSGGSGSGEKQRRTRLPAGATDLLKQWIFAHREHPYPTDAEKELFCNQTGLNISQINNWFTNARRRLLPSSSTPSSSQASSSAKGKKKKEATLN